MLPSFAKQTVTILRAPKITDLGTEYADWPNQEEIPLTGCLVTPGATADEQTLAAPFEADIRPDDRIKLPQGTFEIEGAPVHIESPTGRLNHTSAALKRYRGKQ
jgi:hypothetical protein